MDKLAELENILRKYGKAAVGLSGGVDSTFLLDAAVRALGAENVLAVTASAANFAADEIAYARDFAERLRVRHIAVPVELPPGFWENGSDRCYYCKHSVFSQLISALPEGFVFCDGTNADDMSDYRPGFRAATELGVKSPLLEAHLTKAEIRAAMRERNIEIWNKPAFACLASRIPYGTEITVPALEAVYTLESILRKRGFTQLRARLRADSVSLELLPSEIPDYENDPALRQTLADTAASLGLGPVIIAKEGYRMGSLNREIKSTKE